MILLVVIYHTNLTLADYDFSLPAFNLLDKFFRPIRQPVFFFVSGCLLQILLINRKAGYLARKISVLLYLFGLWSTIQWIIVFQTGLHIDRWQFGTELRQLMTMWYRPETGLWYVWALSIFYVIIPLLLRYNGIIVLSALSAASILAMSKLSASLNFAQLSCFYYAPFFMLGLDERMSVVRYLERRPAFLIPISMLIYLAVNLVILRIPDAGLLFGTLRFASCVLGTILGCSVAIAMARVVPCRRAFVRLGQNTVPIFLSHELLIGLIASESSLLLPQLVSVKVVLCPVIVVVTIFLSLRLKVLVKRIGLHWLYTLPSSNSS